MSDRIKEVNSGSATATTEVVQSKSTEKKKRKRVKKLVSQIKDQLEFYFGDANLRKDRFLKQEMASNNGFVNIDTLLSFNKLKSMTDDKKLISRAAKVSNLLKVSNDGNQIGRSKPLKESEFNVDDLTVYVECLPKTATHDWLKSLFSTCGKVTYVSIPKYQKTGDLKGFAFIEFETPAEAVKACQLLNNPPEDVADKVGKFPRTRAGKLIPSSQAVKTEKEERCGQNTEKEEIKAEESEVRKDGDGKERRSKREIIGSDGEEQSRKRKRQRSEGEDSTDVVKETKKKTEQDGEGGRWKKRKEEKQNKEESGGYEHRKKDKNDNAGEKSAKSESPPPEHGKHDKSKQEHDKHKKHHREKVKEKEHTHKNEYDSDPKHGEHDDRKHDGKHGRKRKRDDEDSDTFERTRRRVDKKEIKSKVLYEKSKRKRNKKKKIKQRERVDAPRLRVLPKKEWLELKNEYLQLQKANMAQLKKDMIAVQNGNWKKDHGIITKSKDKQSELEVITANKDTPSEIPFIDSVVIKFECSKPVTTKRILREQLASIAPVAYIDMHDGDKAGYVRFHTPEGAMQITEHFSTAGKDSKLYVTLLKGDEEKQYWEKINADRNTKLNSGKKNKRVKKKGLERVLSKASRLSTTNAASSVHIRFDDDME